MKGRKLFLIALVYIFTLTSVIGVLRLDFISFIVNGFSTICYNNDLGYQDFITGSLFVFAYAGITFGFTYKIFNNQQGKYRQWAVAWLYDFLSYFIAILMCTLYNNYVYSRTGVVALSSVENFTLIFIFIVLKPMFLRPVMRINGTK